jgi:hypothetical protein
VRRSSGTHTRLYAYVGPKLIADRARFAPSGVRVDGVDDLLRWVRETGQERDRCGCVTATFVVDESGSLRVADRRSEHVACAGGGPVRSAGEMIFAVSRDTANVVSVTNQSTGYCPEPESWPAVRTALNRAGMEAPDGFSPAFVFRRCPRCGSINLVKEAVFECGVCSATLPADWNLDEPLTLPGPPTPP